MKLYFMKQSAVDFMKANMNSIYINYYRETTNDWLYRQFDYDPFELFTEVQDFELVFDRDKKGETDLENCKILYGNLKNISESQASDERLWAGLCHTVFYRYVIDRWDYRTKKQKTVDEDAGILISHFFFSESTRRGFFRNTLAKYWWVGHAVYQENSGNKYELLDWLGPENFYTKIHGLFYNYTFSSNANIVKGICKGWKMFSDKGIKLSVPDYFRPALQNLNALGGGILLDVLSDEEIKEIFFDCVYHLYIKDRPNEMVYAPEDGDDPDEAGSDSGNIIVDINTLEESLGQSKTDARITDTSAMMLHSDIGHRSAENSSGVRKSKELTVQPKEAGYNCRVTVCRLNDNKILRYIIPQKGSKDGWYPIMKYMIGKRVNDEFLFLGKKYAVQDIEW